MYQSLKVGILTSFPLSNQNYSLCCSLVVQTLVVEAT
jgi:hypothetical protein